MKTENSGAVLTLLVNTVDAGPLSDWVGEILERTVVALCKPGGNESVLEIYFDSVLEAEIAECALADFPLRQASADASQAVAGQAGRAVKHSSVREYRAEDWAESWKKHFHAMDIGDRLRVVPPWEAESGVRTQESGAGGKRIEIVINPGLSFGTGNHFTTQFCLEQLDRLMPESGAQTMLDIGTGSGILAITAAKLGVADVTGIDFDEQCVEQ